MILQPISNHIMKYRTQLIIKSCCLICMALFASTRLSAQYTDIRVNSLPQSMKIVQVDNREISTLVFIRYTRQEEGITWMNINEKTIARCKGSEKDYHLINSINLPINTESENRYMMFDRIGQEHAFALEFEKLPNITDFSIYEDTNNTDAFNFVGIQSDTTKMKDFVDIDEYIANYPVKELGRYAENGTIITYIKYKGIIVSTIAQAVKQYGKYYTINVSLQNLSGKSILFDPSKIVAKGYNAKKQEFFDMQVLSASEYDKKVANKQAWNNFWVALGEGMAASNAGYSSSTTTYSGSSYTTGSAHASGYYGNTYGYANAYGSAYTTTYGRANTTSYNGAAAYAAQQQANANYAAYANSQYSIREQLQDGYVKLNTIRNEVNYMGYFNIKYKKLDHLIVTMTIDGEKFEFTY